MVSERGFISFISDRTGEDEIYIQNQNGMEDAIQLTFDSDTYKYNLSGHLMANICFGEIKWVG